MLYKYFKDKTIDTTKIEKVNIGDFVYIQEHYMKPYAKDLSDLKFGKVIKILSKHNHKEGIKVIINIYCTNPNLFNNSKKIDNTFKMNRKAKGRIIYLTDNGKIKRRKST